MKKVLALLTLIVSALTMSLLPMSYADAARLGSGGSIGRQSSGVSRSMPSRAPQNSYTNQQSQARQPAPATAPAPASPLKGMLGGALLGLGLGSLFSHLGGGGGGGGSFFTLILLALAAFFVFRMLKRRVGTGTAPNAAPAGSAYPNAYADNNLVSNTPEIGSGLSGSGMGGLSGLGASTAQSNAAPWGIPADFDVPGFVRSAKTYFIRLQAAWDKADINDIREFTTPEMFAELRMQIQERGVNPNNTDVVQLDAELLGIETVGSDYLASVKFSGLIKEKPEASAEPFTEVWNLSKPQSGQGGWTLAGIQQVG